MNVSTKDEQSSLSETADQAIAEDDATYVSREFLLGDLIKSVTRRFKTLAVPFSSLSESEQTALLSNVADDARRATKEAIRIIESDNRTHFMAEVEQVTFKEGVKAVLKMMNTPESHELADKAGGIVMVVISDGATYMELGDACHGESDQRPLFDDSTDGKLEE